VDTDNQGHQSKPKGGKSGVLRVYALIILGEAALVALFLAVHASRRVIEVFVLLALLVSLLGKQLTGRIEHIQIASPAIESRIRNRYSSQIAQLKDIGFSPLFFYGEAFPLIRLFLIYPAILFLIMLLNREVVAVQGGSKLLFGYPVFLSNKRTAYAHPSQLGMKYHTAFQDGTILMTKNFGGKAGYGPTVEVHCVKNAGISDTRAEHQKWIQTLEAAGKQIVREISFQAYSIISYEA
jgi:hypothetical protein